MTDQTIGMLIGGFVPAVLYGLAGVMQKTVQKTGISLSWYIIFISIGVLLASVPLLFTEQAKQLSLKGGIFSVLIGFFWAFGMVAVALGISKFGVPVSKLAPLYNTNTLIAVILGLLIYAEWKDLNIIPLLSGAFLIILGGILVTRS